MKVLAACCVASTSVAAGFDTPLEMGSWLGKGQAQLLPNSVDVLPDGRILVGGRSTYDFGLSIQRPVPDAPVPPEEACGNDLASDAPSGFCCPRSCGACGGPGCSGLPGGETKCCTGSINKTGHMCSSYDPPCIIDIVADASNPWGAVVVIDHSKKRADSVLQIGGRVDCVRTNAAGTLLVTGDFGAALLSLKHSTASLRWHAAYLGALASYEHHGPLCSLAEDDSVAVLSGCTWKSFNSNGKSLGEVTKNEKGCTGVARSEHKVFTTYFHNSHTGKEPIVMPGLSAMDTKLSKKQWQDYDYDAHQLRQEGKACNGDVADGRAIAVRLGQDGQLYYAGRSDGGNTMYNCQPDSASTKINVVGGDPYTSPYNMRAEGITFVARMNPSDGKVSLGQVQLARLSSGKGNSLQTISLAADDAGNLYLAQQSGCCIENRNNLTVAGQPIAPYGGGDAALMVLSRNLTRRLHWTMFQTSQATQASAVDVSVRGSTVAFVATAHGKDGKGEAAQMVVNGAIAGTSGPVTETAAGGYLAILATAAVSDVSDGMLV